MLRRCAAIFLAVLLTTMLGLVLLGPGPVHSSAPGSRPITSVPATTARSSTARASESGRLVQSLAGPATRPLPAVAALGTADDSLKREAHAAGYLAYGLMFATVVWGVLTSAGTVRRWVRRQTIYGGHMLLSIMAMSFAAVHAMSHLFKANGRYTVTKELVPFLSPLKVTVGVIAFELMVAAAMSVWLQRRLSYHRWRSVHRVAYPAYLLVIGHVAMCAHHLTDGPIVVALVATAAVVLVITVIRFMPTVSRSALAGEAR